MKKRGAIPDGGHEVGYKIALAQKQVSLDGQAVLQELVLVHKHLHHSPVDYGLHLGYGPVV
jgi:hypothetical protein